MKTQLLIFALVAGTFSAVQAKWSDQVQCRPNFPVKCSASNFVVCADEKFRVLGPTGKIGVVGGQGTNPNDPSSTEPQDATVEFKQVDGNDYAPVQRYDIKATLESGGTFHARMNCEMK